VTVGFRVRAQEGAGRFKGGSGGSQRAGPSGIPARSARPLLRGASQRGRRKGGGRALPSRAKRSERERERGPSWAEHGEEEGGPREGKGGPRGVGLLGWFVLFQTLFYLLFLVFKLKSI
jgi:hypothetical protein